MQASLSVQASRAVSFLSTAWPEAESQAREIVEEWDADYGTVVLCGCGDSHHAALGLEMAFSTLAGLRTQAVPSLTASRYLLPSLPPSAPRLLVIGISASGEVARTLEALEMAKAIGARTVAFTGSAQSSLVAESHTSLVLPIPSLPHGPGLLSYLASLLMGYAVVAALAPAGVRDRLTFALEELPEVLAAWMFEEDSRGDALARHVGDQPVVFLGAGPAYGSALFAAAKAVEAAGIPAWGQEVEEWTHLEYFCRREAMPTWMLRAGGRSASREEEALKAARAIGRLVQTSEWRGGKGWPRWAAEALSPLGLWVGPAALASALAHQLGEEPFRGFGGGRSRREGGGASRIRSSRRLDVDQALREWGLLGNEN